MERNTKDSPQKTVNIGKFLTQGFNQVQIAQLLGMHKSTISREIKRDQDYRLGYLF